jgi:hypothetical protein
MDAVLVLKRSPYAIKDVLGPGIHPVLTVHLASSAESFALIIAD